MDNDKARIVNKLKKCLKTALCQYDIEIISSTKCSLFLETVPEEELEQLKEKVIKETLELMGVKTNE